MKSVKFLRNSISLPAPLDDGINVVRPIVQHRVKVNHAPGPIIITLAPLPWREGLFSVYYNHEEVPEKRGVGGVWA
ncbi:MAG: hypothetical protein ACE5GO_10935, partial [Anaerolineales bacterium]